MSSVDEVILVLKLAMTIAPVAVYFIVLGLVNSQSHAHIVSARRDWLSLGMVFFPVLLWPVLWLAGSGYVTTSIVVMMLGAAVFFISAPGRYSGWVVHNCQGERVLSELLASFDALGIEYEDRGSWIIARDGSMEFELSEFALLKNVTVNVRGAKRDVSVRLGRELSQRLGRFDIVPSMSAAAMLVSGTALLILPLAMMLGRMDAFVRVVCDLMPV